ncbi:MAG: MCE family protein [Chloroflexi bacterium]|nr:MAG: MCE family protein [Chloroflexota bacterium]
MELVRSFRRPLAIGTTVALITLLAFVMGVVGSRALTKPMHAVSIDFPTASGLVPGSDVLEAGAKVGDISDISPRPDGTARIQIAITDEHWPLHRGVYADIRPKSLLGEKYVDLHDGSTGGPAYDASKTLTASKDSTPVELDQFINSLDEPTRASLKVLLNSVGAGIAGHGQDLNQAIESGKADLEHLAVTGQTLNNRDPDLDRILVGLDGVLAKLTTDQQLSQMSQLINNGQQTLTAIEAERASWSRSFTDSQAALAELNASFGPVVSNVRDVLNTAPDTLKVLQLEADQLAKLGSMVTAGNTLHYLVTGITHGPTASGGALELTPDGKKLPIFRVCVPFSNPQDSSHSTAAGCAGAGGSDFQPMGAEAVPSSYSGAGGAMTVLADFLGA